MNTRIDRASSFRCRLMMAGAVAFLVISWGAVAAGKVTIPKEGAYTFKFCGIVETRTLSGGDPVFVSHYRNTANTLTDVPGKAFDQLGAICYGTYANLRGRQQDFGICELTDADGDKFWMEYHGGPDGSGGSYTAPHGTGKYDGMTMNGEYTLHFWPSATKDVVQGCNDNKGTYKLK